MNYTANVFVCNRAGLGCAFNKQHFLTMNEMCFTGVEPGSSAGVHPRQFSRAKSTMHFLFCSPHDRAKHISVWFSPPGSAQRAHRVSRGATKSGPLLHLATWSWPRKSSRARWAINVNLWVTNMRSGTAPGAGPAGRYPRSDRRRLSSQRCAFWTVTFLDLSPPKKAKK